MENIELFQFKPNTLEILTPSNRSLLIQETSGADDEILSSQVEDNMLMFLTNVIVQDNQTKKAVPPEQLLHWRINDLEYTLLKWRIFQHGPKMVFTHRCVNPKCKNPEHIYEVDLSIFDIDLKEYQESKNPKELLVGKASSCVKPYSLDYTQEHFVFTTSFGATFRAKYLTHSMRKNWIDSDAIKDASRNSTLTVRSLQIKQNLNWIDLLQFREFSSKQMVEIRKNITQFDMEFVPTDYLTCNSCGLQQGYSPTLKPDFFFPEEA